MGPVVGPKRPTDRLSEPQRFAVQNQKPGRQKVTALPTENGNLIFYSPLVQVPIKKDEKRSDALPPAGRWSVASGRVAWARPLDHRHIPPRGRMWLQVHSVFSPGGFRSWPTSLVPAPIRAPIIGGLHSGGYLKTGFHSGYFPAPSGRELPGSNNLSGIE